MPLPVQPLRNLSRNIIGMPDACEIQHLTWGEDEEGRPKQIWTTLETTVCRFSTLSGTEIAVAGRLAPDSNLRVVMPHGTDVTSEHKLVILGQTYDVEYVEVVSPSLEVHTVAYVSSQEVQQ